MIVPGDVFRTPGRKLFIYIYFRYNELLQKTRPTQQFKFKVNSRPVNYSLLEDEQLIEERDGDSANRQNLSLYVRVIPILILLIPFLLY